MSTKKIHLMLVEYFFLVNLLGTLRVILSENCLVAWNNEMRFVFYQFYVFLERLGGLNQFFFA